MKKRFLWRNKIYLILWTFITLISVYLLVRFASLSFSNENGQADSTWKDQIFSYILRQSVEQGSNFFNFQTGTAQIFPVNIIADRLTLGSFIKDNSLMVIKAQEYDTMMNYEEHQDSEENTEQENSHESFSGIRYSSIMSGYLSKEYILTNGALFASNQLSVGYTQGDVTYQAKEDDENHEEGVSVETSTTGNLVDFTMDQLKDVSFLIRHFYIVDKSTKVTDELFDADVLLGKDMTIKQNNKKPQILIYHTHSQESYIDSRNGVKEDTVVGVGSHLTKILEEDYGYNVIHDTTSYDIVNGSLDRNIAYTVAESGIEAILKENPSIEVVIDLHRDGSAKRSTTINGEETAQIMLFNGLSRDQNGPIEYLDNPNLQDNLAFSLQLQLKSIKLYPGLFYRNYLKSYRYNMHVREKCILMELGTDKNTLQSAMNAMEPFAKVLDAVLQGK